MPLPRPILAAAPRLALALAALLAWAPAAWANGDGGMIFRPGEERISQWLQAGETQQNRWSGEAELGYLAVSGNAPSLSTHASARIVNDRPGWRHQFRIESIFSKAEGIEPSQQYRASQTSAYKLTPLNYLFEALRYDRNVAQGIRWRWSEVGGYGRQLLHDEQASLQLELGAGARQTRRTDLEQPRREPIAVVIGDLTWNLTHAARLTEYAIVESGRTNTLLYSESTLTVSLQGNLSGRFAYTVTRNSSVPVGVEKTDATTSVTLVYKF